MISAYGPGAEAYARGLGDLEAVVTDLAQLPRAYLEAVSRRERGRAFYGMVLYEDPRTKAILAAMPDVSRQIADRDVKGVVVNRFTRGTLPIGPEQKSGDLWATLDSSLMQVCSEFFALSDAILVRSYAEYERLLALAIRPPRVEAVVVEPPIPNVLRSRPVRPGVVVWAPGRPSQQVLYFALGLYEFRGDVTIVTGDGAPLPESSARIVGPNDRHVFEALETASCVVCVEPDDPGAAVAFARAGYGVVAPLSSGAHEFVRDVVNIDFSALRQLHVAASVAIGRPASVRYLPQPPPTPPVSRLPLPREELPLVSVVTATYNRRRDLRRMLTCIARQTYPRIESVVVNDGGESVDDIVAEFPFARLINLEQNVGVARAGPVAMKAARGEYIQALADDDWLQPDHIEALVGAMLRSGASVAHSNGLIRHQEREDDGSFSTVGFCATIFNDTATPTEALTCTPIAGNSMIVRRDVLDEIGTWREDSILADQEFQLRAVDRYALAYVDRMTVEFRSRGKHQFSNTADSVPELRRIYDELHPVPDRPLVEKWRSDTIANVAARAKDATHVFPPTLNVSPWIPEKPLDDGP